MSMQNAAGAVSATEAGIHGKDVDTERNQINGGAALVVAGADVCAVRDEQLNNVNGRLEDMQKGTHMM